MTTDRELLADRAGELWVLASPEVGLFTEAALEGALLGPGQRAGTLLHLGRSIALRVPAGVAGRVLTPRPELVRAPVAFGDVLYRLAPLASAHGRDALASPAPAGAEKGGALALPAPQSGRFYQRPSPGEAPFASPGDLLVDGRAVGLIEVMKTFARVAYRAGGGLPERARLVRYVCPDGGEVDRGAALIEVEPA